ncbi:MAG TPA: hypothetical protein VHP36_02985 [Chitinispirillaceae bacterium]|nr:hypothetical protein [Chitinispirillaceae bacterium]
MKSVLKVVAGLSVLAMMISCSSKSTFEKQGDAAYKAAKTLQGDQKRRQLKTAYIMYDKAIKTNPDKITPVLKNRYIEMTLVRAGMVINEGAAHMEAIPLLMDDIEKYLTSPDISADLKQQYALLLVQLADSSSASAKYDEAIETIDRAAKFASDPAPINAKKQDVRRKVAQENYEMADAEFSIAKGNKDAEAFVKAEFYALTALYFDSTHADAKKLLSTVRKENLGTYSAYLRVIDPIPDSAVFKKVNKYDILMAMPTMQKRGATIATIIDIYNYSYNPLRLKSSNFSLVDVNGKKYTAKAARLTPELLDQEHEAKLKLTFPAPNAEIAKLIYEEDKHLSEKFFF